jgi:hypothetical protein
MPVIIASLLSGLAALCRPLVGRVLLALGIQFVTYQGVDVLITAITDHVSANLTGGFTGVAGQIVAMFRLGEVVSILSGAVMSSLAIRGIRNGSITKMVSQ